MKVSANDAPTRTAWNQVQHMKFVPLSAVISALLLSPLTSRTVCAADDAGIAVAIVYDTSGSMRATVKDRNGRDIPKYQIANRALSGIAQRIQAVATNRTTGATRKIEAGLFVFSKQGARPAVPFGPFDAAAIENWANKFQTPSGDTPLGNAIKVAADAVLKSKLPRKHLLIITDGENTAGPQPSAVIPGLLQQAKADHTSLSFHFVAFDVDARLFAPVKKLDATVVSAADESQLNSQLEYILERKILLEDEEPKK
jgi:hypothetical protein